MYKLIIIILVFFNTLLTFSQQGYIVENDDPILNNDINSRKGQFFASWGWNRSSYTDSDIHFKGQGYDFTLYDVRSQDKPNPFGIKFFSPGDLTLPATNAKIGYFFKDNYNVVLGYDHMKYVIYQYVDVKIDGVINIGNATYDGVYNNDTVNLAYDFLRFEHTDGLNYIFTAINRFDNFNKLLGIQTDKFQVNLEEGIDFGFLYPKTNTRLLGKERHDDFHVSGFGLSAKAGLNLTFFKHFYLQADMKYGYINMPKIRTTNSKLDTAKQHFGFFEAIYAFGWRFKI